MSTTARVTTVLLICFGIVLPFSRALATTDAERKRAQAAMPHQNTAAGGTMVRAHLTRLDGYVEGRPDNASQLARMKAEAQQCMRQHQVTGRATNPPQAWPDFVMSMRTDRYASANRTIAYHFSLMYGLRADDCGLLETAPANATLTSAMGTCNIDLIEKTATGVCDGLAHGNARPRFPAPASTLTDIEEAMKKAPTNAGLAALAAVMRQHPPGGTGERKTVLGLKCEVWKNPLDPTGTICLSTGGTFMAFDSNGQKEHSTMNLETISIAGIKEHSVEAKLDASVSNTVFAPYLAGGFAIKNMAPRK